MEKNQNENPKPSKTSGAPEYKNSEMDYFYISNGNLKSITDELIAAKKKDGQTFWFIFKSLTESFGLTDSSNSHIKKHRITDCINILSPSNMRKCAISIPMIITLLNSFETTKLNTQQRNELIEFFKNDDKIVFQAAREDDPRISKYMKSSDKQKTRVKKAKIEKVETKDQLPVHFTLQLILDSTHKDEFHKLLIEKSKTDENFGRIMLSLANELIKN